MSISLVKLSDACLLAPRLPRETNEEQNVSFLTMSDVSEKGYILQEGTRILSDTKKGFTYFQRDDILLAKITPCFENGKAVYTDGLKNEVGYGSTEFHVIRPLENISVGKYIFYMVWNDAFRFYGQHSMKGAAGHKRVSIDFLKELKIPLPSIQEQQKIAEILDAADTLRQKDQQLIDHYTALSQSLFLNMFGDPASNPKKWQTRTIEKLTAKYKGAIKRGPFGGALKKEIFVKSGYLVYEQFHALNNDFSMARYFIDEEKFDELKGFEAKPGDIIISCSGVYLGKLAIIPKDAKKGIINQALLKITLDQSVMYNDFFVFVFTNKNFKRRFFGTQRGSGVPNFPPMSVFKKFDFICPPLELQKQFIDRIALIEKQKQQAEASLAQSNNLFNSLLQKAFTGELTQQSERAA